MLSHPPTSLSRANIHRMCLFTLLLTIALLTTAPPAQAHDQLIDQSIITDEHDESVQAVQLSFNNEILTVGAEIHVTNTDGTDLTKGNPEISGRDVRQTLNQVNTNKPINVIWRVVSSDGHPIEGAFSVEFENKEHKLHSSFGPVKPELHHTQHQQNSPSPTDHHKNTAPKTSPLPLLAAAGGAATLTVITVALIIRKTRARQA